MSLPQRRLAFTGSLNADHHARALDALCERLDAGARDILYIVASGAARRRAVVDLLARRGAVFGLTVKTMSSLPGELFRRAHRSAPARLDSVVTDLLTERELRTATGNRFGGATPVQGLAARAASTIDLLERNGATPEQLAAALQGATVGDGARALSRAWYGVSGRRRRLGSADSQVLADARDLLREQDSVLAAVDAIVVEDLPLATKVERELIEALVTRAPCDVILAHGYVRQLPEAPSSRALAWLRSTFAWDETVCEPRTPALDSMFTVRAAESRSAVVPTTLLEAHGDVGEVRLAARVVRRHLDAGVRPNDIAIVVHGAAARYRQLIREVFTPAGIPVDATLRRTVADTGIGAVLLQLLELAIHPERMTRDTSLAVARSAHINLRSGDRDHLHQRIINKGYLGLDGWDALALDTLGEHATNRINRLKRAIAEARAGFDVVSGVSAPEQAASVTRRLAKELRLVHNAVVARRRGQNDGDIAIREDNLAWEAIDDALETAVPTMLDIDRSGAGKRGLEYATAWLAMLERALRETIIPVERTPAQAVQVRGTGPGCEATTRVTIVVGLIEKVFPRQARQDPFLDDDLRIALRERFGWDLPTSTDTVDRERECFLRAIASATDALYLSYPTTDADGRPSVRSFFVDDYEAVVGARLPVERASTPSAIARIHDTTTRADLMTAIAHDVWQYLPRTVDATDRRAAAFRALEALARQDADVSAVRHGRRVSQRPQLEGVLPADAPHLTLTLSASQLKALGHCTYEHFVSKVLSPIVLRPPEYDSLAKGTLIHAAMFQWSSVLAGWTRGEAALPELHTWYDAHVAEWSPAKRGSDRTAQATKSDLERLDALLRTELALLRVAGVAQPEYAELAFGEKMIERGPRHPASRPEAFEMEVDTDLGPRTVSFHGSLDRVDVVTIGGTRYGVVLDYKSGRHSKYYAKEMIEGIDLQLRLYLLVLERFWGITPVGALYHGFGDGVRRGVLRGEFRARFAGVEEGPVQLMSPDEWNNFVGDTPRLIAQLVNRLVTLDVRPEPRDRNCGFCDLQSICRYDRWDSLSFRAERAESARDVEES
ncbi:MAG TPA: PD-(D/E)XK nuclease family protein [Gemmatimonadaceae bacterium]|jgi:ATP-dependent helicase/DNAse subunit B|nr:PD-(D/E)XK nuclease family protein [Gemmatimonadaceae bacterium]